MQNKIKPEKVLSIAMLVLLGAICTYVFPPILLVILTVFIAYFAFRA
jgi:hypothetical protein